MQEINVKLAVFEGPLDLLLHLIKEYELDIYDIPIAEVTEQYLRYIHTMKTLELELAGEYLVMAATLMAIKSQMLLPKVELEFEEEVYEPDDPRDALVNQLLEYRKYKYAAEILSEKEAERSLHFTKEAADLSIYEEDPGLPADKFNKIDLFLAFHDLLEKQRKQQPQDTTIVREDVTVEEKMQALRRRLAVAGKNGCAFTSLFTADSKTEFVTSFLALLELIKKGEVVFSQIANYQTIMIYPKEGFDESTESA